MGRKVDTIDLAILVCYYLGATLVLILQTRDIKPRWQQWLTLILQFLFGGLFSALVVFYFKSSDTGLGGTLFVLGLGAMLVTNEFLGRKYDQTALTFTIFTLCGVMFLNFLIPHIVHSILGIWFYLSCFLSLAIVYGIRRFSPAEKRYINLPKGKKIPYRSDLNQMILPSSVIVILMVLYQQQIIPPVPLVLKENVICTDLNRESDIYTCQEEQQPFYRRLGIGTQTLHFSPNERIYNLASVYAPKHVRVKLEQRWFLQDIDNQNWQLRATVPTPMTGGRKNGWRIYSYITNAAKPGKWKVETALTGGAVLARKFFVLEEAGAETFDYKAITVE